METTYTKHDLFNESVKTIFCLADEFRKTKDMAEYALIDYEKTKDIDMLITRLKVFQDNCSRWNILSITQAELIKTKNNKLKNE